MHGIGKLSLVIPVSKDPLLLRLGHEHTADSFQDALATELPKKQHGMAWQVEVKFINSNSRNLGNKGEATYPIPLILKRH